MENLTEQQKRDLYLRKAALGEIEGWQPSGYPSQDKPWLKYYSEEAVKVPLPEGTIYEYMKQNNINNLDEIALDYYSNKISYREFFKKIDNVAKSFAKLGVKQGEIVTVCSLNTPESIYVLYALNKLGAVANMIYSIETAENIRDRIKEVNSKILVVLDIFWEKIISILNETKVKTVIVSNLTQSMSVVNKLGARFVKKMKPLKLPLDERLVYWDAFLKGGKTVREQDVMVCNDQKLPAVIVYSGGTTGGAKGVVLSSENINTGAWYYVQCDANMHRGQTWLQVLPLFIAYGVVDSLHLPLIAGLTLIIRIVGTDTVDEVCRLKTNHILQGPAFWENFADENRDVDLSFLVNPTSGGDVLPQVVEEKINNYLKEHNCKYSLMNGYGMSEMGGAVAVNFENVYRIGSVGIPCIKVTISAFAPETEEEMSYGCEGEICIQGPSMMLNYYNKAEETDKIIRTHKDGSVWLHSGDLGYVSEEGFVYISGRLKRFIHIKYDNIHEKVFSMDIEKILVQHDYIDKCVVVPIADKKHIQLPFAYIILKDEIEPTKETEHEIRQFCQKNLKPFCCPVQYVFCEKFPLTPINKVDYRALEKMAEESRV